MAVEAHSSRNASSASEVPVEFLDVNDQIYMLPSFAGDNLNSITELQFRKGDNESNTIIYKVKWLSNDADIVKKYQETIKPELYKTRCDGPCGKACDPVTMIQFGDCEHVVCQDCYVKGSDLLLYEGAPFCPNDDCRTEYFLASEPQDSCSMLQVRVSIFYNPKSGSLIRKQHEWELSSSTKLKEFYDRLSYITNVEGWNIYYANKPNFHRVDLKKLTFDERRLGDLADDSENVEIIVIGSGVRIDGFNQ